MVYDTFTYVLSVLRGRVPWIYKSPFLSVHLSVNVTRYLYTTSNSFILQYRILLPVDWVQSLNFLLRFSFLIDVTLKFLLPLYIPILSHKVSIVHLRSYRFTLYSVISFPFLKCRSYRNENMVLVCFPDVFSFFLCLFVCFDDRL